MNRNNFYKIKKTPRLKRTFRKKISAITDSKTLKRAILENECFLIPAISIQHCSKNIARETNRESKASPLRKNIDIELKIYAHKTE